MEVLALKRTPSQPSREKVGGVEVFRIQTREGKKEQGKVSYLVPILTFWTRASLRLAWRHVPQRAEQ